MSVASLEAFLQSLSATPNTNQNDIVFETSTLQWWMLPGDMRNKRSLICKKGDTPPDVMNFPYVFEWDEERFGPLVDALRPAMTERYFVEALSTLRPSVSEVELKRYEKMAERNKEQS